MLIEKSEKPPRIFIVPEFLRKLRRALKALHYQFAKPRAASIEKFLNLVAILYDTLPIKDENCLAVFLNCLNCLPVKFPVKSMDFRLPSQLIVLVCRFNEELICKHRLEVIQGIKHL
ncbi:hypothetical protein TSO5_04990 [Azospirillum sp. TSO5]|nr:hypothetical protein TSO5_04990 [Azospirillum sp. TSO5]